MARFFVFGVQIITNSAVAELRRYSLTVLQSVSLCSSMDVVAHLLEDVEFNTHNNTETRSQNVFERCVLGWGGVIYYSAVFI